MNKISLVLVGGLLVAAAGCKKSGDDCAKAVNRSMELSKPDMQKLGMDDKTLDKMKALGIQHCKDDKWSGDAVKCMTDAKTMSDSQACYHTLTKEQQDTMNKAATEMATAPAGGAAGAGNDTGSAAAPK